MNYYADYEALEFDSAKAVKARVFPYYLNPNNSETALCPIFHSICDCRGILVQSQEKNISFIKVLDLLISRIKKDKEIYIWYHNLRYDFRIIIHELFFCGFKQIFDSKNILYVNYEKPELEKTFILIGENLSRFIGVNIKYKNTEIRLRDSMSIINNSQDKILEAFGHPLKVKVDWDKINLKNLKSNMKLIKERCEYDVTSLAKSIEEFKQKFIDNFKASANTAAGISLDALKGFLVDERLQTIGIMESKRDVFADYFPPIEGDNYKLSEGCYHGGICTINPIYAGKIIKNIQMLDINSSYPYAMTLPLPYGHGEKIDSFCEDGYIEYVVYVDFKFNGIPFQRCHSNAKAHELLGLDVPDKVYTRSQFPKEYKGFLCINSIDLKSLKDNATINKLEFKRGIRYQTTKKISNFIRPIYDMRKKSEPVQKLAIKIILNSLYGKFAQDLSGICYLYNDVNTFDKVLAIDNNKYYKPLAGAVTAYARANWIRVMSMLGSDFIYGDTDSVYFKNPKKNIEVVKKLGLYHESELGKWSLDDSYGSIIKQGKFLSKKNYMLTLEKGKQKVVCVGLSKRFHNQVTYDNFHLGSQDFNIEKMVNIYGGKAMRNTVFAIRERIF